MTRLNDPFTRAATDPRLTRDQQDLIDRLRRIEALFAGTEFDGERIAAAAAMDRIRERLRRTEQSDKPVEYAFHLPDAWSRRLFVALLRRYELTPYRNRGQRYTTVMSRVPKSFVDATLWPEYVKLNETLQEYLDDITQRVITECIHKDTSDAAEAPAPAALLK